MRKEFLSELNPANHVPSSKLLWLILFLKWIHSGCFKGTIYFPIFNNNHLLKANIFLPLKLVLKKMYSVPPNPRFWSCTAVQLMELLISVYLAQIIWNNSCLASYFCSAQLSVIAGRIPKSWRPTEIINEIVTEPVNVYNWKGSHFDRTRGYLMSLKNRYPEPLLRRCFVFHFLHTLFCCITLFCAVDATQRDQESNSFLFICILCLKRMTILQGILDPWQSCIFCFPGVIFIH